MSGDAVRVVGLRREFGGFTAVSDVSFDVKRGEIFGYLGANGAGKSTTIRMLCGLLNSTAGEMEVAGVDVVRRPEDVKRRIGYMSQKFSLYPDLTVEDNLDFFGGAYGLKGRELRVRISEMLEMAGLLAIRSSVTGSLPGGLKQRVALANSLVHKPEVLFLDEPTAGVDPVSRKQFLDLVRRFVGSGGTVFLTTHFMDEAEYCSRVGLMVRGRLEAVGTVADLKRQWAPGERFVVRVPPGISGDAVRAGLAGIPGVVSVSRWADGLKVTVAEGADRFLNMAAAVLAQAGVETAPEASGIFPVPATLDDVFVAITSGRLR